MIQRTMRTTAAVKAAAAKVSQTAQKVNDPESCAALTHLTAHPHICAASITAMVCAAFFFILKLFRKSA